MSYLRDFRESPFFDGLVLDERNYDAWAQRIAAGDLLGEGPFTANPLGPYVLALVYSVLGRDLVAVRLVQVAAATVTCALLYRVADDLFGRRAALVTLALAAVYGPLVFVSANLVGEVWCVLLAAGALALLRRPAPPLAVAASGALFALAATGRPNLLPLLVVLPVALGIAGPGPARLHAERTGAWFLGATLVLAPVFARNLVVGGEPVLVTAHGGVNVWIGNNSDADGFFKTPLGSGLAGGQESLVESSRDVAAKALGRGVTASEASRWWAERAVVFALEDPVAFARLTTTKAGYFLNAYEAPLESNYDYARAGSPTLRCATVGFGVVGPLALVGAVLGVRRWRELAVPLSFGLVYSATVIGTFVAMRYRLPVLVVGLPLAGRAVEAMADAARLRDWRRALTLAATIGMLGLFFHRPVPDGLADRNLAFVEQSLCEIALDDGRAADAARHCEEAVRLFPERGRFHNNLGLAYLRTDRPSEARRALEQGIALGHRDRSIYRNLAKARLALGETELALFAYREAARRDPRHGPTQYDIAVVLDLLGRHNEAQAQLRRARAMVGEGALRERIDERLSETSEP
ncbi:MAG: glycosyltransferase family 39 protein [Deltaproteobacteria bacterium]|nr:glycosyltransferase family 39 protein [Deltaproteobacteria bacterium]